MNEEIPRASFWGLTHYEYGEAYFGSHRGMRYRLAREPLVNVSRASDEEKREGRIKASVWKEPFAYGVTEKDGISDQMFDFSEEGIVSAVRWINDQYAARKAEWDEATEN